MVTTRGCSDACPIQPGKRYENWDVANPFGQNLDAVRAIRGEIEAHVHRLLADLLPKTATH
ncbi:hypothetical protein Kisp02_72360 [Kineosporia sp. NBRC 101731]|nr:hypothetical protein [Kineosporia sp. NBRC 101731]GLY33871.1 hypothetical protein Kisp02_72360 [Kineosporia sp. NBRC 101731]